MNDVNDIPTLRWKLDTEMRRLQRATKWGNELAAALGWSHLEKPADFVTLSAGKTYEERAAAYDRLLIDRCMIARTIARMRDQLATGPRRTTATSATS